MNKRAQEIRRLRKERDLTQFEVAKAIGISVKTIYRYEHGKVKRCERGTIVKLADFYGVKFENIWEENDYEK